MKLEQVNEYRIFHLKLDRQLQVHHVLCSQPSTLVYWCADNLGSGLSVERILEEIERHHDQFHKEAEEETAECAGGCR